MSPLSVGHHVQLDLSAETVNRHTMPFNFEVNMVGNRLGFVLPMGESLRRRLVGTGESVAFRLLVLERTLAVIRADFRSGVNRSSQLHARQRYAGLPQPLRDLRDIDPFRAAHEQPLRQVLRKVVGIETVFVSKNIVSRLGDAHVKPLPRQKVVGTRIEVHQVVYVDDRVALVGEGERNDADTIRPLRVLSVQDRNGGIVIRGGIARRQTAPFREVAWAVRLERMVVARDIPLLSLEPLFQIDQRHGRRHFLVGADVPPDVAQRQTVPRAERRLEERAGVLVARRDVEQRRMPSDEVERRAPLRPRKRAVVQSADPYEPRRHRRPVPERRETDRIARRRHVPHAGTDSLQDRRAHHVARHRVVAACGLADRARDQRLVRRGDDRAAQSRQLVAHQVVVLVELVDHVQETVAPLLDPVRHLQESP